MALSSHIHSSRSQGGDRIASHFEKVPKVPNYFDSQTNPNVLLESSILSSRRQLNENYQSHHHNNQLPTDQLVMNRPDVDPTSRHAFVNANTNGLNHVKNANSNWSLVTAAARSAANNSRREAVEQEHRQSRSDYPRVIRPTPYKPYDPRYYAARPSGLPVDPNLHAFAQNPHDSMPKATTDESATTKNIRTDNALNGVPRLHQSSSHSGREIFEQEHGQSKIDFPRVIRPTPYTLYDPRYAAIGLPVDPFLRAFKQYPNFSIIKHNE